MAEIDRNDTLKTREATLAATFVQLADTMVAEFDVVELLTVLVDRCVEVLDVDAAGLMLVSPEGDLRVMASSSETMRVLELFEIQSREGPCLDSFHTGRPIVNRDVISAREEWPLFSAEALAVGFKTVHAMPLRLRNQTLGAINLFQTEVDMLTQADIAVGQALADVATIAILHHRAAQEAQILNDQLNYALNSRIVIEQAKGMIAERGGLSMEAAFSQLRNHARNHNLRLVELARDVSAGTTSLSDLDKPPPEGDRLVVRDL